MKLIGSVVGMKHVGMDGISTENLAAGMIFIRPLATSVQHPPLLSNYFPFFHKSKLGNTQEFQKFPFGPTSKLKICAKIF